MGFCKAVGQVAPQALPDILLYGPQGGNTCKANEYLDVDSLLPTTKIYLNTVLNILGAE